MTDLLIRYDATDTVVRSVGAAPHGIVCMGVDGLHATWCIDASYEPPRALVGAPGGHLDTHATDTGLGPASTPVGAAELVAGCESTTEATMLMRGVARALLHAAEVAGRTLRYEFLQTHLDLAFETRAALVERGFLRPPEAS